MLRTDEEDNAAGKPMDLKERFRPLVNVATSLQFVAMKRHQGFVWRCVGLTSKFPFSACDRAVIAQL